MEYIKYLPTAPEREVYPKVVDLTSVTLHWGEMIFLFSAGVRDSSVADLGPSD